MWVARDIHIYSPEGFREAPTRSSPASGAKASNAKLIADVFSKATRLDAHGMLKKAERSGALTAGDYRRLDFRLKKSDDFSLKEIPIPLRQHFSPVLLNPGYSTLIRGRVLLVDDLLATGRTLAVASQIISQMETVTSVEAACLFSSV